MQVDATFWRSLRQDFESLQGYEFSLVWNSRKQSDPRDTTSGESHWSWWRFPDESLKARLSAIALRGALALGHDSEDAWYDELRQSKFVQFKPMGSSRQKQSDGVLVDSEFGPIKDVVKESITLCYRLEAGAALVERSPVWKNGSPNLAGWQEIRAKFTEGANAYPDLTAHWDSHEQLWTLRNGSPESDQLFKEAVRIAVAQLGKSGEAAPSWHVWLDLMRREKRGFQYPLKPRNFTQFRNIMEAEVPLDLSDVPRSESGEIRQVFKESADFCADLASREQATAVIQAQEQQSSDSPVGGTPSLGMLKEALHLPELPPKFQNGFEAAKANAELEQAKLTRTGPHPAVSALSRLKLIQDVFFAYCAQARAACRAGEMTVGQARQAAETALPVICDLYFVRDHGTPSDDAKAAFRVHFAQGVTADPRWHQHLLELAELAEGASRRCEPNAGASQNPNIARANDSPATKTPERMTPHMQEAPDVARPKRLRSTISSPIAARRMEAYLASNPKNLTAFALQAQTTDRTLRKFRKTGEVRRNIFENIAKAMGVTPETLLRPD